MNEITKKRRWNADAIAIISKKRGITKEYVRQILRGDRVGEKPSEIKKEYGKIDREINEKVKQLLNTQS